MKILSPRSWLYRLQARNDLPLLLVWIVIGGLLRFAQLTAKPPWTDEVATLVFSLGNNYQTVPLNQVIPIDVLLQPLQPNPDAGITDVVSLLLNEDNHPPLYFVLAHLWMKLLPLSGEYVDLWAARSLPALFGVLSIPAIYWLARLAFRSRLVAQLAAAMMAVSPYAVFLAQEARHYTLGILWVIASLGCLIAAAGHLWRRTTLPIWLVFLWVAINSLGIATHYFFSLTLCAEAMSLILLLWHQLKRLNHQSPPLPVSPSPRLPVSPSPRLPVSPSSHTPHTPHTPPIPTSPLLKNWRRLGLAAAGTIISGLVWLLIILPRDYGNGMVDWIRHDQSTVLALISPVFQTLAAWITMLSLLPVEASSWLVVLISGAAMILFFLWALPFLYWGLKVRWRQPDSRLAIGILAGFIASAIALFFWITYFLGIDLTRGARYCFVYFPSAIVLVGASLAACWHKALPGLGNGKSNGKIAVVTIWLMGLLSAITVCLNLGYQKYYRPDLLVPIVEKNSWVPVVIATTHKSLVQTGEMIGLAWELRKHPLRSKIEFLLVHQEEKNSPVATVTLQQVLNQLPRPLDLWAVNFYAPLELNNCVSDSSSLPAVNGYNYSLYHCSDNLNLQGQN